MYALIEMLRNWLESAVLCTSRAQGMSTSGRNVCDSDQMVCALVFLSLVTCIDSPV